MQGKELERLVNFTKPDVAMRDAEHESSRVVRL